MKAGMLLMDLHVLPVQGFWKASRKAAPVTNPDDAGQTHLPNPMNRRTSPAPVTARLHSAPITMWRDFKAFLVKNNIIALAVAFVVGAATNELVQAFVADFIMPIVGRVTPG